MEARIARVRKVRKRFWSSEAGIGGCWDGTPRGGEKMMGKFAWRKRRGRVVVMMRGQDMNMVKMAK